MNIRSLGVLILLVVAGCGDPITRVINDKFPPINIEEQRQAAIDTSATALSALPTPNIAVSVALEDLRLAIPAETLKKEGITALAFEGEEQLVRVTLSFDRAFTDADADENANAKAIITALRPSIVGSIDAYASVTGALANDKKPPEVEFKLLPGLSRVHVDRITIADKADATKAGEAIAWVLNRYKNNVTGELSRASFTRVSVPALAPETIKISDTFKVNDDGTQATIDIQAKPITVPVKLAGVGWLIHDNRVTGIVQLSPLTNEPVQPMALEKSFNAIRSQVEGQVEGLFGMPDGKRETWVAVRKDLVATTLNSAVNQAAACAHATGTSRQAASTKIPMPDGGQIDCTPTRDCSNDRSCSFTPNHDTRSCDACLAYKPKICAFGGCVGGGCLLRGNDPTCEFAKAAQNKFYEADAAARKLDCERLKAMEKASCELEKAGEKALCEAGKAALNALARTGNFANLDIDANVNASGVSVCMREFTLSPALDKMMLAIDAQGKVKADVGVSFVPLDIVGHLACQFPWTSRQEFEASLRESRVTAESGLKFVLEDKPKLTFATQETTVKTTISPGPTEYFLKEKNMMLACQGLNLLRPLTLVLTPFIKELQGDIDFKVKGKEWAIDLPLPEAKVGGQTLNVVVRETPQALVLSGTLAKPRNVVAGR